MNADQFAALMGMAASVPRMPDAACRGEAWLADLDVTSGRERIDAGIETCLGCRQLQRCSDWVDALPPGQQVRGVVAGRLVDPAAYQTARAVMVGELRPHPPQEVPKPRGPRRPARRLLAASEAAGEVGLTVREAAAVLYGPEATLNQAEQTRQALERMRRRGVLCRVDRGQTSARGRVSRYMRVDVEAAAS